MSEVRKGIGLGGIAILPIACCIGLPLLLAASVSAAAFVWGGVALGAVALVGVVAFVVVRRRTRTSACRAPLAEPHEQRASGIVPKVPEEVSQR
jgi:heme exporter protein D